MKFGLFENYKNFPKNLWGTPCKKSQK